MLDIRPARPVDVFWLAEHLRPDDQRECETASGKPVRETLLESFHLSSMCFTAFPLRDAGSPVCIFGVAPDAIDPHLGVCWLVGTPEISRWGKHILTRSPRWLSAFLREFPAGLHNYVDQRNTLHLKWLSRLGFQKLAPVLLNSSPFEHVFLYV